LKVAKKKGGPKKTKKIYWTLQDAQTCNLRPRFFSLKLWIRTIQNIHIALKFAIHWPHASLGDGNVACTHALRHLQNVCGRPTEGKGGEG